jgi:UDP-glucose 4-epimerase
MDILLTGGLGYIGSNICVLLLKEHSDKNIIIIDNLVNSSIERIKYIEKITNKKVTFYNVDLVNKNELKEVFKNHNIDVVIHLAGLKAVNESIQKPLLYYENNIQSTINLLNTMIEFNCKNIIFSSSATVYGMHKSPFYETTPKGKILSPYGKTKDMIEEILEDTAKANNIKVVILRYFNPIGSDDSGLLCDDPNGIPNNLYPYILKVYNNKLSVLNIFGNDYDTPDGTCVRDFIHVVDLAYGHIKTIEYILSTNKNIDIFNLGTGKGISVLELITAFEKVNNVKINYKFANRRDGDIDISIANVSKAQNILNWTAKKDLYSMVKL